MRSWRALGWLLVALAWAPPLRADDAPEAGAPPADAAAWRREAQDLVRRAQEAERAQECATALELRTAAVALLRAKAPGTAELADASTGLGGALLRAGRPTQALALQEEALGIRRRLFAGDRPEVAESLGNVGAVLMGAGRARDALPRFEAALAMQRRLVQGDHVSLAIALNNVAFALQHLGRVSEALPLYRQSLEMRRRLFPGDHLYVATSLNNVGFALQALGRPTEALPLFEEALAMRRRLLRGDHADVAVSLNNVAHVLQMAGRTAEALPLFEEARAINRRLFPDDHPGVASSLANLALALQALGRVDDALVHVEASLAMYRRVHEGDHPEVARTLGLVGQALQELGRPAAALPCLEESLAMARRLFDGDHPAVARALERMGSGMRALGRPADALPRLREALAMQRRLHDGDHPELSEGLRNLGGVLVELERFEEALPLLDESLAMMRRLNPGDHPGVAGALNDVAESLSELGRSEEALARYREALSMKRRLFPALHPDIATGINNLACVLLDLGRPAEALPLMQEAYAIARRTASPQRYQTGCNWGSFLLLDERPQEALEPLATAIEALETQRAAARGLRAEDRAHFLDSLRGRADPYAMLVTAQVRLGDPAAALETLERGRGRELLDLLLRGQIEPLDVARARAREAGDLAALGNIDAAERRRRAAEADLVERAAATERARAGGGATGAALRTLAEAESKARVEVLAALSQVQRLVQDALPEARPLSAPAIQALLAPSERLLAYSLSDIASLVLLVAPDSVQARDLEGEGLPEAAEALRTALAGGKGSPSDVAAAAKDLFRLAVPTEVWEAVRGASWLYLLTDGPLVAVPFEALVVGEKEGAPVSWAEVGPRIAYEPSASVLSLLRARVRATRTGADLVAVADPVFAGSAPAVPWPTRGALIAEVEPGGAADRAGLRPGDVIVAYAGQEIATSEELGARLDRAGERATAVPVGFVRDGERRTTTTAQGALGVFLAQEPPDVAGPELLADGPSSVVRRNAEERGRRLRPLPGTRAEVEGIASAFRKRLGDRVRMRVLLGREASEGRLFEAADRPRILHLATHGLVDETETASFSALALSMPSVPVPDDDGFLTLIDLFSRWRGRLEGTELVVLSACDSTRGKDQGAEGMYALPWGFLYAGARSVVGSLWKVDDQATALLMTEFHRRLLASDGKDPLEALAQARLALMAQQPHPNRWSAFVFTGSPD